ncbi:MAG: tRNA 4-thiouridine(8) synthase ThiI [Mycoplasmataceae bacterium]|jgi:thiamine biosynthesis protein ThiI|nr:tRNA 4-thiouridine(8) synthase ThiI [Mycoplasmataceae bacterium]
MFIYIKYGELTLKGKNISSFINCLFINIKKALINFKNVKIIKKYDYAIVTDCENEIDDIIEILKLVPGIYCLIKAYTTSTDIDVAVKQICAQLPTGSHTFKVVTKRIDKKYPINSMDYNKKMGELILGACNQYHVDIHHPEITVGIEIKASEVIYYFNKIKGTGGFPLGINGRVLLLMSGGIDSPVAGKLLMKKGLHVDFLTFITPPHTNPKALKKVEKLRLILTKDGLLESSKLYIINFTNLQNELAHMSNSSYQITIMRRYFFRIARDIALKFKYQAIATGESLGQVASQTMESMATIQNAIGEFCVLRPLLAYDKSEIIQLAKVYGTYDVSIEPFPDCCALFVPKSPATKPTIHTAAKLEEELEMVQPLYEAILDKHMEVKI